ncbi:MAG: UDP-N-acetylglucosamine--N-acetylmuramyl-(pentapeptide) pyrophosphoryl-undecaprenol N-acetylglucosamine transferase [Microgenomates group bacterium]
MKILITGGHLAPALAFIEEYLKNNPKEEIIFVGRKYINNFERVISLEYKEIANKGIKFIDLATGRLTRVINWRSIINFLYIPLGFFNAYKIINEEKPDFILSFGGYIALPLSIVGFFKKIPVFTHEQTIKPGLASRIIGLFAKKIFVSFPESIEYFDKKKTVVIGNPIKEAVLKVIKKPFDIKKDRPVIYVTGGSLGSHSINVHIGKILEDLLKKYIVIHQTGETKQYQDYDKLKKIKAKNYFLRKHFYSDEIGYIYQTCDLVIARAGANTFFELLYLKKPTIFIPLPWSANKEQLFHAQIFKKYGIGEIFNQNDKSYNLKLLIDKMIGNIENYKKNFYRLKNNYQQLASKNASQLLVREIKKQIQ